MKKSFLMAFAMLFLIGLNAQETPSEEASQSTTIETEYSQEEMMALVRAYMDSVTQTLNFETGVVQLQNDLATLTVPDGFKYLNGKDSEMVLTDLWGNPPSEEASLGMLFPEESGPSDFDGYAINITYSEEGYIDDSDAKDIDYDDLLLTMQEDARIGSEQRIEMGYEPIEMVGWASAPFYDEANKKLHWAKELKFGDSPENTLNYNIRVLGRKGYLNLNVIGEMKVFSEVQSNIDNILPSVAFNEGNRYADFNPDLDQVAAYGIGGLIAGKVLAKAGILAKIGIVLAKFWKVILLGLVGFGASIKKFFFGTKTEEKTPTEPTA